MLLSLFFFYYLTILILIGDEIMHLVLDLNMRKTHLNTVKKLFYEESEEWFIFMRNLRMKIDMKEV